MVLNPYIAQHKEKVKIKSCFIMVIRYTWFHLSLDHLYELKSSHDSFYIYVWFDWINAHDNWLAFG